MKVLDPKLVRMQQLLLRWIPELVSKLRGCPAFFANSISRRSFDLKGKKTGAMGYWQHTTLVECTMQLPIRTALISRLCFLSTRVQLEHYLLPARSA